MTYSIAARCERTGAFGAAIATAMPAVGALCVWTRSGVGVVCTQSWTNAYLGLATLDAMAAGLDTGEAGRTALGKDRKAAARQLGAVGATGPGFAFTGEACTGWCGHRAGPGFAAQGNMLTGREVVEALASGFAETAGKTLDERLLAALEAAQGAGGDRRGRQSAALAVIGEAPFRTLDLRVDDHPDPVAELRRVHGVARAQLGPMARYRPDAEGTAPDLPEALRAMVMTPPPDRPGGGGSGRP